MQKKLLVFAFILAMFATNVPLAHAKAGGGSAADTLTAGCPTDKYYINTAIGCIPFEDMTQITQFFLRWAVGMAGGLALILIVVASYRIMTSQGDPRRMQGGQELLLSAIGGLVMVVLSVYLLRFIGVDLFGLF